MKMTLSKFRGCLSIVRTMISACSQSKVQDKVFLESDPGKYARVGEVTQGTKDVEEEHHTGQPELVLPLPI